MTIYIPCQHARLHNGGWLEEQQFFIAGRSQRVAIAPCMLLCATSGRVQSWLETLAVTLHRKIVHEFVLRQILLRRYGEWFDFRSVGELLRGLPVFYRSHSDRYYLLRDVAPLLPRPRRKLAKNSVLPGHYAAARNEQSGCVLLESREIPGEPPVRLLPSHHARE